MFLRQVYDPHLAQYAYIIGCQRTGEAIVIDPLRDVAQYRVIAKSAGLNITAVAETHIHADFVSGARELAADGKTAVYVSAEGGADWQSEWVRGLDNAHLLRGGDVFNVGGIKLQVLHTPGHTPEHICFLITDEGAGASEPMALISGDFLFVGDVGRPDLLEQAAGIVGSQEPGAAQLYHSLRKLRDFPDHLQIWPGHGAGSACGKSLGAVPMSTLGYERKYNAALKLALNETEEAFVSFILAGQPEPPLYFANMKRVNKVGPTILGEAPLPPACDVAKISSRLAELDFVVLDTRSDRKSFAAGHLKGSLYAPSKGDFTGFAGSYLMPNEKVVLVVDSAADVERLTWQLRRIGFDQVLGWLSVDDLARVGAAHKETISIAKFDDLEDLVHGNPNACILDVRHAGEFATGNLRGAVNIAHTRLRARSHELPGNVPVIVHCLSGNRASAAVAWLQREGHRVIYVNDVLKNAPAVLLS